MAKSNHTPVRKFTKIRKLVKERNRYCKLCRRVYPNTYEYFPEGFDTGFVCKFCVEKLRVKSPERYKFYSHYLREKEERIRHKIAQRKSKNTRCFHSQHIRVKGRGMRSDFNEADWMRALNYFHWGCAVCGRQQGFWHILAQDHWIPFSKGGHYSPLNIVPLCHGEGGCNNKKSDRDALEWLTEVYGIQKARRIQKRIADYFQWVACQSSD